jgi:hypothetical protein
LQNLPAAVKDSIVAYWPFTSEDVSDLSGRNTWPFQLGNEIKNNTVRFNDNSLEVLPRNTKQNNETRSPDLGQLPNSHTTAVVPGGKLAGRRDYLDFENFGLRLNFKIRELPSLIVSGGVNPWLSVYVTNAGQINIHVVGTDEDAGKNGEGDLTVFDAGSVTRDQWYQLVPEYNGPKTIKRDGQSPSSVSGAIIRCYLHVSDQTDQNASLEKTIELGNQFHFWPIGLDDRNSQIEFTLDNTETTRPNRLKGWVDEIMAFNNPTKSISSVLANWSRSDPEIIAAEAAQAAAMAAARKAARETPRNWGKARIDDGPIARNGLVVKNTKLKALVSIPSPWKNAVDGPGYPHPYPLPTMKLTNGKIVADTRGLLFQTFDKAITFEGTDFVMQYDWLTEDVKKWLAENTSNTWEIPNTEMIKIQFNGGDLDGQLKNAAKSVANLDHIAIYINPHAHIYRLPDSISQDGVLTATFTKKMLWDDVKNEATK